MFMVILGVILCSLIDTNQCFRRIRYLHSQAECLRFISNTGTYLPGYNASDPGRLLQFLYITVIPRSKDPSLSLAERDVVSPNLGKRQQLLPIRSSFQLQTLKHEDAKLQLSDHRHGCLTGGEGTVNPCCLHVDSATSWYKESLNHSRAVSPWHQPNYSLLYVTETKILQYYDSNHDSASHTAVMSCYEQKQLMCQGPTSAIFTTWSG
jgi:hypothetical protein